MMDRKTGRIHSADRALRARLTLCLLFLFAIPIGAIAQNAATPNATSSAPPAVPTPNPFIPFSGGSRVFVFAVSGDAPTRAKFVSVLTHRLQKKYLLGSTKLVPESDWGIADYINACQNNWQSTAGALIIQIGEISNISTSFLAISRTNKTRIHAALLYSKCQGMNTPNPSPTITTGGNQLTTNNTYAATSPPQITKSVADTVNWSAQPSPSPSPFYSITWQSDLEDATGYRVRFFTPLTFVGFLSAIASGYTALAPTRTITSQTTRTFASPAPAQTIPPAGLISSQVNTNMTVANPSQLGAVSSGLLGSALTYAGTLEQISTTDQQSLNAVNSVIDLFVRDLACDPNPSPAPPDGTPEPAPSAKPGNRCPLYT